jgi:hypothetical protein
MGVSGRAKLLRSVSETLGLDGEEIIPPDEQIEQLQQQMQMAQAGAAAQGNQPGETGTKDMGPRERGPRISGGVQ